MSARLASRGTALLTPLYAFVCANDTKAGRPWPPQLIYSDYVFLCLLKKAELFSVIFSLDLFVLWAYWLFFFFFRLRFYSPSL